jgi:hypothetical protein
MVIVNNEEYFSDKLSDMYGVTAMIVPEKTYYRDMEVGTTIIDENNLWFRVVDKGRNDEIGNFLIIRPVLDVTNYIETFGEKQKSKG